MSQKTLFGIPDFSTGSHDVPYPGIFTKGKEALSSLVPTAARTAGSERVFSTWPRGFKHDAAWGAWQGREEELFLECDRLVKELRWPDVLARIGPAAKIFAKLAKWEYEELSKTDLPQSFDLGAIKTVPCGQRICRVQTYSELDPLFLPWELLDALVELKGQTNNDRFELEPSLVQKLVDFEILVERRNHGGSHG